MKKEKLRMYAEASCMALYEGTVPSGISNTPLIINACLTGNVLNRDSAPNLPMTTDQIIDDALRIIEQGASMLHIHARGDDGLPDWRPEPYARIFEGIRKHNNEVVLIATTSGREYGSFERRAALLELCGRAKPDMASLTLGSLNFPSAASLNTPDMIQRLAERMKECSIVPELEVFDMGMLNYAFYLRRKGLLPRDCYVNLLLGSLGAVPGRVLDLCNLVREIPASWTWAAAGIGRYQLAMNTAAIIMGGHVRVGLEDSPLMDYQECQPATNAALVARIARIAREIGRPVSTCVQTRQRIGDADNWQASTVHIRRMQPEDLEAVVKILAVWNMEPRYINQPDVEQECDHININNTFIAVLQDRIVGVASFTLIDSEHAETASLAVAPDMLGCGIGYKLQDRRLKEMRDLGIRHVRTETDRPLIIRWYIEKFGYRKIGTIPKRHAFSDRKRDEWTVLRLEL
jgi:3-keto-5-aminohexanoate cleavage enzyme